MELSRVDVAETAVPEGVRGVPMASALTEKNSSVAKVALGFAIGFAVSICRDETQRYNKVERWIGIPTWEKN